MANVDPNFFPEAYPSTVSPEEQARRDAIAAQMRAYEVDHPEYGGSAADQHVVEDRVSKVSGTSVKLPEEDPNYFPSEDSVVSVSKQPVMQQAATPEDDPNYFPAETPVTAEQPQTPQPKPPVEEPGLLPSIAQDAANLSAGLGASAMKLVGGVADVISPEVGDTINKAADAYKEHAATQFLTPEQQQARGLVNKVVSGAVNTIPVIATAAIAPEATIVGLATHGLVDTSTSLLKQGVDLQRASVAGLYEAARNVGATLIPATGKTVMTSMALGGLANPAVGFVTDLATEKMFPDRPDIQKQFDPYDLDKRVVEGAIGLGLGYGFHKMNARHEAMAEARKKQVQEIMDQQMMSDITPALDEALGPKPGQFKARPGESVKDSIMHYIKAGLVHETDDAGNITMRTFSVKDLLDLLSQDTDSNVSQRALAQVFSRMAEPLKLDTTSVSDVLDPAYQRGSRGLHRASLNRVELNLLFSSDYPRFVRTMLHETAHAISGGAIRHWESYMKSGRTDGLYHDDPRLNDLIKRADNLYSVYELAQTKALLGHGFSKTEIEAGLAEMRTLLKSGRYYQTEIHGGNLVTTLGKMWKQVEQKLPRNDPDAAERMWDQMVGVKKNLHEFVSELTTNKGFQEYLLGMRFSPTELPQLKSNFPRTIKNMWEAVRRTFNSVLGVPNDSSVYHVAMDHVFDMLSATKAEDRAIAFDDGRVLASGKKTIDIKTPYLDKVAQTKQRGTDFNANASDMAKVVMRRIAGLIQNVYTKEELATRLYIQSSSKVWETWVKNNIDHIWNNSDTIMDMVGKSDFNSLSPAMKKLTGDDRTLDQFVHEEFPNHLDNGKVIQVFKEAEDMKGAGRQLFSPTVLNMMKDGFGGAILRFVNHKSVEYKSMGDILYHKSLEHFQDFNNLPRKSALSLMKTIALYDRPILSRALKDQGLQWMTEDMLKQAGHTPEEIAAYKGITAGEDFLWSLTNQALLRAGKMPIEQIPGYMPHIFPGPYKVLVKVVKPLPPNAMPGIAPEEYVIAVRHFRTKWNAQHYVEQLEKGQFDTPDGKLLPQYDTNGKGWRVREAKNLTDSLMMGIEEHVGAYRNGLILHPQTLQALEKIEVDNMRGMTRYALERSNIAGYLGELGPADGIMGWRENNKLLKIWQNHAKNITDYYRNTMFVQEVLSPLTNKFPMSLNGQTYYGGLFPEQSVIQRHINEIGYNFTGKNLNKLPWFDDAAQSFEIFLGIDPMLHRHTVRAGRNLLSLIKLRANPGNYAANFYQPMHVLSQLEMVNVMLQRDGVSTPSAIKSMAEALDLMRHPDKDMVLAKQWARDNHHLDAQLEYELHDKNLAPIKDFFNKATGGLINPTIESFGRELSFTMAYHHFRQIYKDNPQRARDAATNVMKLTMIDYDATQRPLMYQNFGSLGESLSPFAVFRNGYVGNTLLMAKLFLTKPSFAAAKPFLYSQLNFLFSAGMVGIIGISEYNFIINQINSFAPESDLPTFEELAYKILTKNNWPSWAKDAFIYGGVSSATKFVPGLDRGVYMGSSMNAVGADDVFSAAIAPFLHAIASVLGLSLKEAASYIDSDILPPSQKDYYRAQKQLTPGIVQPWLDRHYMAPGSDVAPQTSSLQGGVVREPSDWAALYLGGRRSLGEAVESTKNRIQKQNEQQITKTIKQLVDLAVDRIVTGTGGLPLEVAASRAAALGMSRKQFVNAVNAGRESRIYSAQTKEQLKKNIEGKRLQLERSELGE